MNGREASDGMRNDEQSSNGEWIGAAMERFKGPLLRYAVRITGDFEGAQDVVQDTFLRLCGEDHARLDGHLAEWLFTVCRRRALDVQRKERRMESIDDLELAEPVSRELSPATLAEQRDSTSHVQRLLATLPVNQREVVCLKFQNGLSYQEISRITNLSLGNVGFLIHTALATIRQRLHAEEKLAANSHRRNL